MVKTNAKLVLIALFVEHVKLVMVFKMMFVLVLIIKIIVKLALIQLHAINVLMDILLLMEFANLIV